MRRTLLVLSLLVISGIAAACSQAPTEPVAQRETKGINESGYILAVGVKDTVPN